MALNRKRIIWIVVGVAVLGMMVNAFRPKPVDVDLATVSLGALRVTVNEDGRTRVRERYVVSAPIMGRLARIDLDPGDAVEAGKTLVAAIEPADATLLDPRTRARSEATRKAAQAANEQGKANLERATDAELHARKEWERAKKLGESGALSVSEADRARFTHQTAENDLRSAEAAVQIARFELEQAEAALMHGTGSAASGIERFDIRSPIDGCVLRRLQESSIVVPAGTPLLELGDPAQLEVVIDVLSRDAVRIDPGNTVILQHWGGEQPLTGRVRIVEPAAFTKISSLGVEEQRVNVIAELEGDRDAHSALGDGFRVEANIVVWEADSVLKAPAGALFREGDDWAAFRVENGKAKMRRIKAGHSNGIEVEVIEGLKAGDEIVLHPSDALRDGSRIASR
ncbi:MAG: efflux RND transporter periplasmic adaptor subunit [Lentisphaerae bacterium]|nr:efflux RND transporter periplasmic adaptor subunit [Lentisphaerota bacterium]